MKRALTWLCLLTLAGCDDREIKTYSIAKEPADAPGLPPPAATTRRPRWSVPAGWKELPPSGMRAATFTVEKSRADISVVTFPGTAGGLLSNLNRWRGQLGLPAIVSESEVETILVNGQPSQIVELTSTTEDKAIFGAIYLREDQSWFLKLTGTKAEAAALKDVFESFAKSFQFDNAPTSTNNG